MRKSTEFFPSINPEPYSPETLNPENPDNPKLCHSWVTFYIFMGTYSHSLRNSSYPYHELVKRQLEALSTQRPYCSADERGLHEKPSQQRDLALLFYMIP